MIKHVLLTMAVLAACADADDRRAQSQVTATDAVAACRQFTRDGLKLKAKNRTALQAEAGRASNTHIVVEPNRHVPGQEDSIIRLDYDGLTIQLRKPGAAGELFEYVAVSKRKWLNFPYFRPGVPITNVIAVLGEPQRRDANRLIYNCGETEAEAPLVFETKQSAVQRIVFNYYVD